MMNQEQPETNHHTDSGSRGLKIALIIVVVFMAAEIAGGLLSHSLSLLGDAGHMLVDALALVVESGGFESSQKASHSHTHFWIPPLGNSGGISQRCDAGFGGCGYFLRSLAALP